MEALLQLQKETIESLRQLVESQRLTIEQMSKSHEEQTAQLNQTIANLNETVEYLKKKLFASSSEKSNKDVFPGQINLFNEAEAAADPSVPEPTLEEAVRGYNRQARITEAPSFLHSGQPRTSWTYWIRSTFAGVIRSSSRTTFFPMTSIGVLQ